MFLLIFFFVSHEQSKCFCSRKKRLSINSIVALSAETQFKQTMMLMSEFTNWFIFQWINTLELRLFTCIICKMTTITVEKNCTDIIAFTALFTQSHTNHINYTGTLLYLFLCFHSFSAILTAIASLTDSPKADSLQRLSVEHLRIIWLKLATQNWIQLQSQFSLLGSTKIFQFHFAVSCSLDRCATH